MNFKILVIILATIGFIYIIFFNILRIFQSKKEIPESAYQIYSIKNFDKAIKYLNERRTLSIIKSSIAYIITIILLASNSISYYYYFLIGKINNNILVNMIIVTSILFIYLIVDIIFSYIALFKIEEKYGFNKRTLKMFIKDNLIIALSKLVIAASLVIIGLDTVDAFASDIWSVISIIVTVVVFGVIFILMRYFARLKPLPEGSLKNRIEAFANKHNFKFKRVFISNASKRTNKANAYFQGFWFFRKIVLFDTLLINYTEDEIMAVFAHEIAHAKNKDTLKLTALMIPFMLIGIFGFTYIYDVKSFYQSFKFNEANISLTIFAIYVVIDFFKILINLVKNPVSRKMEYRADRFEAESVGKEVAVNLHIKLSKNHLSDVNPHPADVFLNYSHPTPIQRIDAIKKLP